MTAQPQMLTIPLANLETNPVALREVNKEALDYVQLRDSIERDGLLNAINVVPSLMADGKSLKRDAAGNQIYRICDGLHRFTACKDLGWTEINAQVLSKNEAQIAVAQLVANAKGVKTKNFQFAKHLNRILSSDQTMTVAELAETVSSSPQWLNQIMGMTELHEDIGKLVDGEKITVSNAVELAKLKPHSEQLAFLQAAMEDSPGVFVPKVKARIKELKDAQRAGRDPNAVATFVPTAHLRSKGTLEQAASAEDGGEVGALIKAAGITDPIEVARFSLRWALHLDEVSVREAKAKDDARKAQATADAAKRAKERADKRAQETAAEAAKVTAATNA